MLLLQIPFIIPFLIFMAVLKAFDLRWFNWIVSAFLVVLGPFAVYNLLIPAVAFWVDPARGFIILPHTMYALVVQLIAALILFRFLERLRDTSIAGWYGIAFLGVLLLYMLIPAGIGLVL